MHHRHFKRVGATALLALAGLLGSLLIAPAAPASTLYACQKKKGGTLRIVSSKTKCKKSSEKKISWSTTGPAGKNGTNGSNGSNGSNGTNGTNGAAGVIGLPGQPQKAFTLNTVADTGGLFGNTTTNLFTTNGVKVDLFCANFIANFMELRATGPAGTVAQSGMIATRTDDTATQSVQVPVYSADVTADTVFGELFTNTTGVLTNKAQFNAQIQTSGAVIVISASMLAGPSPTACTIKGVAFAIPT